MNLELRSIVDAGNIEKERITLRARSDLDVGDYLLAQSGYVDQSPTTDFYHTFWFPYELVEKGDLVVVYTKVGTPRTKSLKSGKRTHFYYWGLKKDIWNNASVAAVILHAPNWESKAASDL